MFSSNTSSAADANFVEDVFSTWLYTGTGATQTITNGIDLAGKGGLVWVKARSTTGNHRLFDTTRGVNKPVYSNLTNAQATEANTLTAFNANGFTLGSDAGVNQGSQTWASWTFREQPKFFDVVTYTGDGAANRRISHNLGSAPGCIIVKCTNEAQQWISYHNSLGIDAYLKLNSADGSTALTSAWGNSSPTSTDFGVSALFTQNKSGNTYVAYLFAHNAGGFGLTGTDNVISCGSFTTNGSGLATVDLGYEPQYFLVKPSSNTGNWEIVDNMRGFNNAGVTTPTNASTSLFPNLSAAETYAGFNASINSNGFTFLGNNSWTYIYIAIRRGPMKVPTTGTSVFDADAYSGDSTARVISTGFPSDLNIMANRTSDGLRSSVWDRLRGFNKFLPTSNTGVETTYITEEVYFDNNSGYGLSTSTAQGLVNFSGYGGYIGWAFRRSPGFMDVCCYTGTGAVQNVTHNLAVVPELIIVKGRSGATAWQVYSSALANTEYLVLNTTAAKATGATHWNSTSPTSTVFSLGAATEVNTSAATYVAYLFATCPGVSKVGSYTGTGTTQTINCGFTAGSRFVLIKRTDNTGDWYVWDSARGIVSGNDPYLRLNDQAVEVTSTDYIDTSSAGFEISSTAPAAINANGGTFIFLAIA